MNYRSLPPRYVGMPLAALIASLCGQAGAALQLFVAYAAVSAASLAAYDAFLRSAARLLSRKKLLGAGLAALLMTLLGTGICMVLAGCVPLCEGLNPQQARFWIGAAGALVALRCLGEIFASQGDAVSAQLSDILAGVAIAGCLLVFTNDMQRAQACCIGICGVLLLSAGILIPFSWKERPEPSAAIFREVPFALGRVLLYPAAAAALAWAASPQQVSGAAVGFFAGLLLMELFRTPFRHSTGESSVLQTLLPLTALALSIAAMGMTENRTGLLLALAAIASCILLFGALNLRSLLEMLALTVAVAVGAIAASGNKALPWSVAGWISLCACAAAGLLSVPEWLTIARRMRANAIRRRAHRSK